VAGRVDASADVHIGVTHSPEPRILDGMASDGFTLLLAGHTHGGQVCVPGVGALVTNCGLDRRMAKGLHRWSAGAWLHVSAGLGTHPTAPVRFACRPEATMLTLVPR
jgi:predicted MPP superfamily phosphohydrolase